jgi:hypothetical protein
VAISRSASLTPRFQLPNSFFKLSRLDCLAARGDSAGFIGRQLAGSHCFGNHAESFGDVGGRLDWGCFIINATPAIGQTNQLE